MEDDSNLPMPVCRVCMLTSLEQIDLEARFDFENDLTYLDGFNYCTHLNVQRSDTQSNSLCSSCANELKISYEFIRKAVHADSIFRSKTTDLKIENEVYEEELIDGNDNLTDDFQIFDDEHLDEEYLIDKIEAFVDEDSEAEVEVEALEAENVDDVREVEEVSNDPFVDVNSDSKDNANLECKLCKKTFNKRVYYVSHMDKHLGNRPYQCNDCDKAFFSAYVLRKHVKEIHERKTKIEKKIEKCSECDGDHSMQVQICTEQDCVESFTCPKLFKEHKREHRDSNGYQCQICSDTFTNQQQLYTHRSRSHSAEVALAKQQATERVKQEKPGKKYVKCDICQKELNVNWIRKHMETVHSKDKVESSEKSAKPEKRFLCHSCPKTFKSRCLLLGHEKYKHTDLPVLFTCPTCGKGLTSQARYKAHLQIHDPNRQKFSCTVCNRQLANAGAMKQHMLLHTAGNLECVHCGKKFSRQRDLDVHMRFHTGNYPFSCDHCDKRFAIASHLKSHVDSKHLGVSYQCGECNAVFKTNTSLRNHRFVHQGFPFNCPVCEKGWTSRFKFRRHLKNIHKLDYDDSQFDAMYPKRNIVSNFVATEVSIEDTENVSMEGDE